MGRTAHIVDATTVAALLVTVCGQQSAEPEVSASWPGNPFGDVYGLAVGSEKDELPAAMHHGWFEAGEVPAGKVATDECSTAFWAAQHLIDQTRRYLITAVSSRPASTNQASPEPGRFR